MNELLAWQMLGFAVAGGLGLLLVCLLLDRYGRQEP